MLCLRILWTTGVKTSITTMERGRSRQCCNKQNKEDFFKKSWICRVQQLSEALLLLFSPYRRTRTGRAAGGCFPKAERSPAKEHTQTNISICYLLFTWAERQAAGSGELHKQHGRSACSQKHCKGPYPGGQRAKRREAGEASPGNSPRWCSRDPERSGSSSADRKKWQLSTQETTGAMLAKLKNVIKIY